MAGLQYSSLDLNRREIRLLRILPGRWSAGICCDLDIVSLDEEPAYTALSYVWGTPDETVAIVVQGSSFQATKNLVAAMRRLRSSKHPLTVWIDAICIDQNNLDEKTQQITMMGSIYESASEVAVFLGESGILDIVSAEEMEAWLDAPSQEWHRDGTILYTSQEPPVKAFLGRPQTWADLGAYMTANLDPQVERADPKEHPMWAVFDPPEGIKDQSRVDAFFERQMDPDYGTRVDDACRLFRESEEGAFAIMNQVSTGRCLKSCLRGATDSVAWANALRVIKHISELPWWSRVWVMQESILPKGRVFAIYGENRSDDINLFGDAGSTIPRHHERAQCCKAFWDGLPTWQQDVLRRFAKLMDPFSFIRDIDKLVFHHPLARLHGMISRARHLGATDARDKVFGLLGLALRAGQETSTKANRPTVSIGQQSTSTDQQQSRSGDTVPTVSGTVVKPEAAVGADLTAVAKTDKWLEMLGVVADYKQTTVEVYTRFALRLMLHYADLGVLAAKEIVPLGLEDLPSWVPKWSPLVDGTTDYLTWERRRHFMACHSGNGAFPTLIDKFALAVVGLRFDRIAATTRPFYQAVDGISETVEEIETFIGLDVDPDAMYQDSIPLTDAAWRTMVGDLLYYVDKSRNSDTVMFARIAKADIQLLRIARLVWDGTDSTSYIIFGEELISLQDGRMLEVAEIVRRSFWFANEARLFFKTEHGYIGSAPADAIVGDEIAIVEGSCLPFVLRRAEPVGTLPSVNEGKLSDFDDSWFRFVGCTYICGIMDGEAGYAQSAESIQALIERAGDAYSRELHLAATKMLANGDLQRQILILA